MLELLASDRDRPELGPRPARTRGGSTSPTRSAALEVEALRAARRSPTSAPAPGFPGLALAAALPDARVDLIESIGAQVRVHRAGDRSGGDRQRQRRLRARRGLGASAPPHGGREALRRGHRARRRPPLDRSRSSPRRCCATAGVLVAWKGRRDPDEEAELERAAERLAMEPVEVLPCRPVRGLSESPPARAAQDAARRPTICRAAPGWRRSARSGAGD